MIVAVDNDVIEKCTFMGLLDDLPLLLGSTLADLRVLPSAKYRYGHSKPDKAARKYGPDAATRMLDFCRTIEEADAPHQEDIAALFGVLGLDEGELALMSYVSRTEGALLATGDKRSLRALATAPEGIPVAARLAGRVICFEQIIARAIVLVGFTEVLARVVPEMRRDTAISVCFSAGATSTAQTVNDNLATYVAHLRTESAGVLIDV